jgi:hypothetical protein
LLLEQVLAAAATCADIAGEIDRLQRLRSERNRCEFVSPNFPTRILAMHTQRMMIDEDNPGIVMRSKAIIAARLPVRRGLSESEAAIYLSLSPTFFRKLVEQGVMPRPRIAGNRRIWDIEELDLAFKALPREGGEETPFGARGHAGSWADFQ